MKRTKTFEELEVGDVVLMSPEGAEKAAAWHTKPQAYARGRVISKEMESVLFDGYKESLCFLHYPKDLLIIPPETCIEIDDTPKEAKEAKAASYIPCTCADLKPGDDIVVRARYNGGNLLTNRVHVSGAIVCREGFDKVLLGKAVDEEAAPEKHKWKVGDVAWKVGDVTRDGSDSLQIMVHDDKDCQPYKFVEIGGDADYDYYDDDDVANWEFLFNIFDRVAEGESERR